MCYDLHGAWEPFTGHNSPLYGNPDIDTGDNFYLNVVRIQSYIATHGER